MPTILFPIMGTISHRLRLCCCALLTLCFACPLSALEPQKTVERKAQDTEVYRVIKEFVVNVRKGNLAKAYQAYTSHDFRETTPLSRFMSFVSQSPVMRRNRSVELIKIKYREDVASVNVTLESTEHGNAQALFVLRYDEGHWRIISIELAPVVSQ